MDSAGYVNVARQSGLLNELQTLAQNIANASTVGYQREGVVFSEFINAGETKGDSISMATARGRYFDATQGALNSTGGQLDMAIEGEGYFAVETPEGERLTRAGNFSMDAEGTVVTAEGYPVQSADGAAITVPDGTRSLKISSDGNLSADGQEIAQLKVVTADPLDLRRVGSTMFEALKPPTPAENPRIAQGFLEQSNVNPVVEIARLVEVQRAYELGQGMLDREHDRITKLIQTVGRAV